MSCWHPHQGIKLHLKTDLLVLGACEIPFLFQQFGLLSFTTTVSQFSGDQALPFLSFFLVLKQVISGPENPHVHLPVMHMHVSSQTCLRVCASPAGSSQHTHIFDKRTLCYHCLKAPLGSR